MINKNDIKEFVISNLKEGHFLIDVAVGALNQIQVYIDSLDGLPISECVFYSKLIEEHFDRDVEDYELSVSSGGLDLPFTVPQQFEKYLGLDVEIVINDGRKQSGVLTNYDGTNVTIEVEVKELIEGKKRKEWVKKDLVFNIEEQIKTIKPEFSFKKEKKK